MKTKLPSFINLLVLTLITSFTWIGFSIQRAVTQNPEPVVTEAISREINPNLDLTTIEKIKSRLFLSDDQIPQTQFSLAPTPGATSTPTPAATPTEAPSATQTATPTPTGSAEGGTGI